MNNAIFSTMIRAGRTTFFIDVREAKNGNKFIAITESSLRDEAKRKTTIRVFGETIQEFRRAIDEAVSATS